MTRLSIITAVLNRADTIGLALDSLDAQRGVEVEHLVLDGGSTDGTLQALQDRAHPGMRLWSGRDGGLYHAINLGIARAEGEVIGLLHSDDAFAAPDVLARVAQAFADPGVEAVYGDLLYVAQDDPGRVVRRWVAGRFDRRALARGWMAPHPTLFLRRAVFDRLGAYDTSFRIAADYEAMLRYFGAGGIRPLYLPQVMVRMQLGGASNGSLRRIWRKSAEDYRAIRASRTGGIGTLALKNLRKLPQFIV